MANVTRLLEPGSEKLQWIDRAQTILDLLTRAGTMWLGYNAFEKLSKGSGLSGAIVSQIAMKLATSNNLIAGGTGVGILGMLGITNLNPTIEVSGSRNLDVHTWAKELGAPPEPIDVHVIP